MGYIKGFLWADWTKTSRYNELSYGKFLGVSFLMCQPLGPVLLVEDEKTDAMMFRRSLEKITKQPRVVEVRNGDDAVEYLAGTGKFADRENNPLPSIIVLDIKLPRRNGFEILDWIRQQPEQLRLIPVLMLSSSDRTDDVEQSYIHGANSYLTKPSGTEAYQGMVNAFAAFWLNYNEQAQCPRLRVS